METNCYIPSSIIDRVDFFYGRVKLNYIIFQNAGTSTKIFRMVLVAFKQNGADKPKERNIVT